MPINETCPCRYCRFYEEDAEFHTCYCNEDMESVGTSEGCFKFEERVASCPIW